MNRIPTNPNTKYDSFIKSAAVTYTDDITLAHKSGHALGLYHRFVSSSGCFNYCPPSAGARSTDNDQVMVIKPDPETDWEIIPSLPKRREPYINTGIKVCRIFVKW